VSQFWRGSFQIVQLIIIEIIENAFHVLFFLWGLADQSCPGPRDWLRRGVLLSLISELYGEGTEDELPGIVFALGFVMFQ
jgi:hypothetical protein